MLLVADEEVVVQDDEVLEFLDLCFVTTCLFFITICETLVFFDLLFLKLEVAPL